MIRSGVDAMAVRKRKKAVPAHKRGREFKVILPPEMSDWIESQAREEGKPQSRIIIDHLSRIPFLEAQAKFDKLVNTMESILARYGSRVVLADIETFLLPALDDALAAKSDGELQARLDTLRVARAAMLRHEQHAKEWSLDPSEIPPLGLPKTGGGAKRAAQPQAEPTIKAKRAVRRSPAKGDAAKTGKR
jgi:hypothetical protein